MLYPGIDNFANPYGNTLPVKCFGKKDDFDIFENILTSFINEHEDDKSMADDVRTAYRTREKIQKYTTAKSSDDVTVQFFEREAEDVLSFLVRYVATFCK